MDILAFTIDILALTLDILVLPLVISVYPRSPTLSFTPLYMDQDHFWRYPLVLKSRPMLSRA